MRVSIVDRAELEGVEISDEGYLLAYARVARTGVYDYAGAELGRPDIAKISVLRSADAVFDTASVATLLDKPVTNDHPSVNVVAENWAQLAVGNVRDEAMRDGEFLRVPLTIKSKSAVKAYQDGKKELSPGYRAEITFVDGVAPDGTAYQATMTDLRYNHLALVDKARGGSHCRIGDSFTEVQPEEKSMKRFVLDGVSIDLADATAVETALAKLQTQVKDGASALTIAQADVARLTTDSANKDAKIATLEQAVTDAKMTPAQINDAVKALATVRDAAKKLAPTLTVTDAMDAADIRKAVVTARLGDKAKDWTDAQIEASFGTLTDAAGSPVLDKALGNITNISDAQAAHAKAIADRNARFETDYRAEAK